MLKTKLAVVLTFFAALAYARTPSDAEALTRARERLARMTLDEKASLCGGSGTMSLPAVPRVGITNEWQFSDSSHTVRATMDRWSWAYAHPEEDRSTVLPTLNALACTWNTGLAGRFGDVLGSEARARGKDQLLGPGVNIMRTPLCGRNWEYCSEDPYLTARLIVPEIRAIQRHDVAACVKHFCLNNQEYDRYNVNAVVDERALNEIYLPGFKAAVREAGVWTLMTSYNYWNGIRCAEHPYLLSGVLRDRWGFMGSIVTDWGGQHSTVPAALSGAGIEMNCGSDIRYLANPKAGTLPLAVAVREGRVPEAYVDDMALRVLWVMEKTDFFSSARKGGVRNTEAHQATARAVGEEAIVLLKNAKGTLPLDAAKTKKILLVGNLADKKHASNGGWSAEGNPPYEITPAAGIEEYYAKHGEKVEIVRAPIVAADSPAGFHGVKESAITTFDTTASDQGMSVRAWKAGYWDNTDLRGEAKVRTFQRQLDVTWGAEPVPGVKADCFSVRFETELEAPETGSYRLAVIADEGAGTRIWVDGMTIAESWRGETSAFTAGDAPFEAGRKYWVAVDYHSASGKPSCSFKWLLPSERGGTAAETRRAADAADAVIVFTGTELGHGRARECEGADRPDLRLPEGHDAAIAEILSWKIPNTVIVNHSGAPVEMPWIDAADAVVQEPYLGQEAGRPLARVLFGDVNPSGKLPCTWPVSLADTPAAHQPGGYTPTNSVYSEGVFVGYRWYEAQKIAPLFPFGHGLSYTSFDYTDFALSTNLTKNAVKVSVTVSNTGKRRGAETVQLYVGAVDPAVARPVKELRGFEKIDLKPGASRIVTFVVNARDLAYWDSFARRWRADAGVYRVWVGRSCADTPCVGAFTLERGAVFAD